MLEGYQLIGILFMTAVVFGGTGLIFGYSKAENDLARGRNQGGCASDDHEIELVGHLDTEPFCIKCGLSLAVIRSALYAASQAKSGR